MKKKVIALVVTVVLLGAMVGLLLFLNSQDQEGEEEVVLSETIYILGGEEALSVSRVQIDNEYGSYTAVKSKADDEDVYSVEGWSSSIPVKKSQLSNIFSSASSMAAKSIVADGGVSLSVYGLDAPRATVRITAEGDSPVLLVGNDAPGSEGTYVMVEGNETVYLLTTYTAQRFLAGELEAVDLTLTGGDPATSTFTRAVLGGTVREEEIVIERAPEESEDENPAVAYSSAHQIVSPVKISLDITSGNETLGGVFGLSAAEAVAVNPTETDLAAYGLEEPYSTLKIESEEDGRFTLSASQPDEEGMAYLTIDTVPGVVYRIGAESLGWLESQVFDLMSKMLILPYIDSVSRVTVRTPDQSHVFELDGEGDELAVTLDGEALVVLQDGEEVEGVANFRKFYQTLIAASYREYTDEELPEGAEPILEFRYEYREGSAVDTVAFYEGTARRMMISLNGGSPNLVESTYVDRVLADLEKVLAGEAVASWL